MSMSMNSKKMLNILAILGTSSLILGNIAVPSYAFLKQTSQSEVNTDTAIDKQVLKGIALILKGVNTILTGKMAGGLDEVSLGANMIRTSCNITGENGANGAPGNSANGGQGGQGGKGGSTYCGSGGSTGIGSGGSGAGIGGAGGGGGAGGAGGATSVTICVPGKCMT